MHRSGRDASCVLLGTFYILEACEFPILLSLSTATASTSSSVPCSDLASGHRTGLDPDRRNRRSRGFISYKGREGKGRGILLLPVPSCLVTIYPASNPSSPWAPNPSSPWAPNPSRSNRALLEGEAASSMALRLRCGGSWAFSRGEDRLSVGSRGRLSAKSCFAVGVTLPALSIPARPRAGSTAAVCSISVHPCREGIYDDGKVAPRRKRSGGRPIVSSGNMDEWMQGCIVEIVRNIREAPFLVHVSCNDQGPTDRSGGGAVLTLEMEAADPEKWRAIRSRWDRVVATPPDGLILVEELKSEAKDGERAATTSRDGGDGACSGDSGSKTWGIVVQGWGVDCAACYILSTCRVRSAFGFCTHFCLTKARCFGDTADVQLKKLWLV